MAMMQLDESWIAIREIWERPTELYYHSSRYASRDLYTPPRSRPQSSRHGASNESVIAEETLWPCTPLSEIFESIEFQNHKGIQQIVNARTTEPPSPQDSPRPLFMERTPPRPNTLHESKSRFFVQTRSPPRRFEDTIRERYRKMEHDSGKEMLVSECMPHDCKVTHLEDLSSNNPNDPDPRRRRLPKPAPAPTGPFLTPSGVQYRTSLPDSVLKASKMINLDLIRCCTLMACYDPDCLKFAESALVMSEEARIYHLVAKSQLYRGLCLFRFKCWKEASLAFTRAASVRDWMGNAWEMKNLAEKNLLQESRTGKRRSETVEDEIWKEIYF